MDTKNDMCNEICTYIGNMYEYALKELDSVNSEFVLRPLDTLKESKVLVRVDPNISGAAEIRYNLSENTFYIGFQSDEVLQTHHEGVGNKETIVRVLVDACNSDDVVKAWFMGLGNQPLSGTGFLTYKQITSVKQPGTMVRERSKFTEVSKPSKPPKPSEDLEEPRERIKFRKVSPPSVDPEPPDGSSEEPPKGPLES